jgi:hypothetical protein
MKPAMPMTNIRLRPTMSPSRRPVSRPAVIANVYAAPSHWIIVVLPPRPACMAGPAMLVTVASRSSITEKEYPGERNIPVKPGSFPGFTGIKPPGGR